MSAFTSKAKKSLSGPVGFLIVAVVLFWIKIYTSYIVEFDLGITNTMQEFLLFINPISSAVIFFSLALLAKGKRAFKWLVFINIILSFVQYANIVYYRFFNDFITWQTLKQTENLNVGDGGGLLGSVMELLRIYDPLYFLDTIILVLFIVYKKFQPSEGRLKFRKTGAVFAFGVGMLVLNVVLAEIDRPQLLTRTFDRNYLVKYLGTYNYTIYDGLKTMKVNAQKASADSSDLTEVQNFVQANYAEPNKKYFGAAEGMNVIYIHLESFQNFLIDYKLHGEEVTPFINSLTKDKNTLYFDNFYHQTGQGKTSDSEMLLENSLFGLSQGSAMTTNGNNTYQSAASILEQEKGYSSAVFHGNYKSFWNRDEVYKHWGVQNFFDASYYDMKDEDVLNYGLKDKPFFEQSKALLESLPEPFYTKFITVSHHFPYPISEEDATIEAATTGDGSVDRYFQTARYLDESVEEFVNYLKETGLYDRSVLVFYGDHYGISDNHNEAMAQVLNKEEITKYDSAELQEVPLIIRVPGMEGGVQHQYGGQIDLLPTLLHLLGVDSKNYIQLGTDLLSEDHTEIVPFRNGNFMSPNVKYIDGKYYDSTGTLIEETEEYAQMGEYASTMLAMSDKIIYGDLLRFYTPEGFKPVDPSKYNYNINAAVGETTSMESEE